MLVCWANGANNMLTKSQMFQVLWVFFVKSFKILCKNPFKLFFLFSYEITKMKIKSFEFAMSIRNYEKEKYLEHQTTDNWSTSHLSHRPSEPAYYILDSDFYLPFLDNVVKERSHTKLMQCTVWNLMIFTYFFWMWNVGILPSEIYIPYSKLLIVNWPQLVWALSKYTQQIFLCI